ncbi:hypothetical protein B0T10DRAFT_609078 [Thelonectria olida]|uniref:Uncharacterized protein n=1 Tax=Thelonectria olida TaxID=1576542 RepID=A0A9P8VXS7_9HYPO|nr:hypothetical protein B0T10DRAFT_609078 [Thelonectria olida]
MPSKRRGKPKKTTQQQRRTNRRNNNTEHHANHDNATSPKTSTSANPGSSRWDDRPGYVFPNFAKSENARLLDGWDDDPDDKEGVVEWFMNVEGGSPKGQTDLVLSFCPNETMQELEWGSSPMHLEKSCLLDDRSNNGTCSTARDFLGPLTARQLQSELRKERFVMQTNPNQAPNDDESTDTDLTMSQPRHQISADRRLIFMTNLDRFGMMALITTASDNEARVLRGAFSRHISPQSDLIAHRITSIGFRSIELSFDIHFYSWVTSSEMPTDGRSKSDKKPLRQVSDLSFLTRGETLAYHSNERDYLCEAKVSLSISVIDDDRWVAYGFFDNYFDESPGRDSVEEYDSFMNSDGDPCIFRPDPFTKGLRDADKPILDPRMYFWVVFEIRMQKAKEEWQYVVSQLKTRVKTHIDTSPSSPIPEQSCSWVDQTNILLRNLLDSLTTTIRIWRCFQPDSSFLTEKASREHEQIEEAFRVLEICVHELECIQKRCKDFADTITRYMNVEANRDTKIAARAAIDMINYVVPMTLSAAVLSMQESAIPAFLGPTKLSFIILSLILMALVPLSFAARKRSENIGLFLMALYERLPLRRLHRLKENMKRLRTREEDEEQGGQDN